jgi:nitrate reductase NapE component
MDHKVSKFESFADHVVAKVTVEKGKSAFTAFLILTFLVLIGTSTVVLHYFKCHEFPDDYGKTQSYLYRDYSVDCHSSRYKHYVPFAVIMVFIYPVGSKCF